MAEEDRAAAACGSAGAPPLRPCLHGDRLYILNDNEEESYLLALDKLTGEKVWRVDRDEKSNWSTPFVWKNDQRTEIVTAASGKVRSYDLDGKLLWWFKGMSGITVATPYADRRFAVRQFGFYAGQAAGRCMRFGPAAAGDISLPPGKIEQCGDRMEQADRRAVHPHDAGL